MVDTRIGIALVASDQAAGPINTVGRALGNLAAQAVQAGDSLERANRGAGVFQTAARSIGTVSGSTGRTLSGLAQAASGLSQFFQSTSQAATQFSRAVSDVRAGMQAIQQASGGQQLRGLQARLVDVTHGTTQAAEGFRSLQDRITAAEAGGSRAIASRLNDLTRLSEQMNRGIDRPSIPAPRVFAPQAPPTTGQFSLQDRLLSPYGRVAVLQAQRERDVAAQVRQAQLRPPALASLTEPAPVVPPRPQPAQAAAVLPPQQGGALEQAQQELVAARQRLTVLQRNQAAIEAGGQNLERPIAAVEARIARAEQRVQELQRETPAAAPAIVVEPIQRAAPPAQQPTVPLVQQAAAPLPVVVPPPQAPAAEAPAQTQIQRDLASYQQARERAQQRLQQLTATQVPEDQAPTLIREVEDINRRIASYERRIQEIQQALTQQELPPAPAPQRAATPLPPTAPPRQATPIPATPGPARAQPFQGLEQLPIPVPVTSHPLAPVVRASLATEDIESEIRKRSNELEHWKQILSENEHPEDAAAIGRFIQQAIQEREALHRQLQVAQGPSPAQQAERPLPPPAPPRDVVQQQQRREIAAQREAAVREAQRQAVQRAEAPPASPLAAQLAQAEQQRALARQRQRQLREQVELFPASGFEIDTRAFERANRQMDRTEQRVQQLRRAQAAGAIEAPAPVARPVAAPAPRPPIVVGPPVPRPAIARAAQADEISVERVQREDQRVAQFQDRLHRLLTAASEFEASTGASAPVDPVRAKQVAHSIARAQELVRALEEQAQELTPDNSLDPHTVEITRRSLKAAENRLTTLAQQTQQAVTPQTPLPAPAPPSARPEAGPPVQEAQQRIQAQAEAATSRLEQEMAQRRAERAAAMPLLGAPLRQLPPMPLLGGRPPEEQPVPILPPVRIEGPRPSDVLFGRETPEERATRFARQRSLAGLPPESTEAPATEPPVGRFRVIEPRTFTPPVSPGTPPPARVPSQEAPAVAPVERNLEAASRNAAAGAADRVKRLVDALNSESGQLNIGRMADLVGAAFRRIADAVNNNATTGGLRQFGAATTTTAAQARALQRAADDLALRFSVFRTTFQPIITQALNSRQAFATLRTGLDEVAQGAARLDASIGGMRGFQQFRTEFGETSSAIQRAQGTFQQLSGQMRSLTAQGAGQQPGFAQRAAAMAPAIRAQQEQLTQRRAEIESQIGTLTQINLRIGGDQELVQMISHLQRASAQVQGLHQQYESLASSLTTLPERTERLMVGARVMQSWRDLRQAVSQMGDAFRQAQSPGLATVARRLGPSPAPPGPTPLPTPATGPAARALEMLRDSGTAVSAAFSRMTGSVSGTMTRLSSAVGTGASTAGRWLSGLAEIATRTASAVGTAVSRAATAARGAAGGAPVLGGIVGGIGALSSLVPSAVRLLGSLGSAAAALGGSVAGVATSALSGLASLFTGLVSAGMGLLGIVGNLVGGLFNIGTAALGAVGKVLNFGTAIIGIGGAEGPLNRTGSALGGIVRQALGLALGVVGIRTFGEAIKFVDESVVDFNQRFQDISASISAFTRSTALAADITAQLRRESDFTPFKTSDLQAAGESLVSAAKGSRSELMSLLQTAEVLAALKPAGMGGQGGIFGAAFSIREAVAGQFESVERRFGISIEAIGRWRAAGVSNIEAVRNAMHEMGADTSLVQNLANTFSGATSTVVSFFNEIRRSAGEGIFNAISQQAIQMAQGIRTNAEGIYERFYRIGNVIGGVFQNAVNAVRGFLATIGPVGRGIQQAFSAFEMGDFSGFFGGIGNALTSAFAMIRDHIRQFAQTMFGEGSNVITNLATGMVTAVQHAFGDVATTIQNVLSQVLTGRSLVQIQGMQQAAQQAGQAAGVGVGQGVQQGLSSVEGDIAQSMANISQALHITVPGDAGEEIKRVDDSFRALAVSTQHDEQAVRDRINQVIREPGETAEAYQNRLRTAQTAIDQEVKQMDAKLRKVGSEGVPNLRLTADQIDNFVRSIEQAKQANPGDTIITDDMLKKLRDFRDEAVSTGQVIDNERTRSLAAAAEQAALAARIRRPDVEQGDRPRVPVPDFRPIQAMAYVQGQDFMKLFGEGAARGLGPAQEVVGTAVSVIGQNATQALDLGGAINKLRQDWGDLGQLKADAEALNTPIQQYERILTGLQLITAQINLQMQGIQFSAEEQIRPMQAQLRAIELQRDVQLDLRKNALDLAAVEQQRNVLAAQGNQERRAELEAQLQGINRERDRLSNEHELAQIRRVTARFEGADPSTLRFGEQLLLNRRKQLETQVQIGNLPPDQKALTEAEQALAVTQARATEVGLLQQRNQLLIDSQKIPLERHIQEIQKAEQDLLDPLQKQLNTLQQESGAVSLVRDQFKALQQDFQSALFVANQNFATPPDLAKQWDAEFQKLQDRFTELGGRAAGNLGQGFSNWLSQNFGTVYGGTIGAALGSAFGPLGLVAGAVLGSNVGSGMQGQLADAGIGTEVIQARLTNALQDTEAAIQPYLDRIGGAIGGLASNVGDFWDRLNKQDIANDVVGVFNDILKSVSDVADIFLLLSGRPIQDANDALDSTQSVGSTVADVFMGIADAIRFAADKVEGLLGVLRDFVDWWQHNPIIQSVSGLVTGALGITALGAEAGADLAAKGGNIPVLGGGLRIIEGAGRLTSGVLTTGQGAQGALRASGEEFGRAGEGIRNLGITPPRQAPAGPLAAPPGGTGPTAIPGSRPAAANRVLAPTAQDRTALQATRAQGQADQARLTRERTVLSQQQTQQQDIQRRAVTEAKRLEGEATVALQLKGDQVEASRLGAQAAEQRAKADLAAANLEGIRQRLDQIRTEMTEAYTRATASAVSAAAADTSATASATQAKGTVAKTTTIVGQAQSTAAKTDAEYTATILAHERAERAADEIEKDRDEQRRKNQTPPPGTVAAAAGAAVAPPLPAGVLPVSTAEAPPNTLTPGAGSLVTAAAVSPVVPPPPPGAAESATYTENGQLIRVSRVEEPGRPPRDVFETLGPAPAAPPAVVAPNTAASHPVDTGTGALLPGQEGYDYADTRALGPARPAPGPVAPYVPQPGITPTPEEGPITAAATSIPVRRAIGGETPTQQLSDVVNSLNITGDARAQIMAQMNGLGDDAVQGFLNALRDGNTAAARAIADLGDETLDSLRQKLQASSPSRAMRLIGRDTAAGFLEGLTGHTDDVRDTMGRLGQATLNSLDGLNDAGSTAASRFRRSYLTQLGTLPGAPDVGPPAAALAAPVAGVPFALPAGAAQAPTPLPATGAGPALTLPPITVTVQFQGPLIGEVHMTGTQEERAALLTDLQTAVQQFVQGPMSQQIANEIMERIITAGRGAQQPTHPLLSGAVRIRGR